ncbi:MAG: hypothetical protein II943_00740 [Victivallales bacterium]|nr:hypothetical protein [Victivallales bacterium]
MPVPAPPSTLALERTLLHRLLTRRADIPLLPRCKESWFTSRERRSIFALLRERSERTQAPLTDAVFAIELTVHFPGEDSETEARRALLLSEWRTIAADTGQDTAEAAVREFERRELAGNTQELLVSAFNDLQKGDVDGALQKIREGTLDLRPAAEAGRAVGLWSEAEDWLEEVTNRQKYPDRYAGIKTGFAKFDEMTGGLFPAELTVVFGLSGKGKSTLMKQIGVNVRQAGYNVLHCGNEEDEFQMRTKYTAVETDIPYAHWKRGTFSEVEMRQYKAYRDRQVNPPAGTPPPGEIYVYSFPQQTDATLIERKLAEFRERGIKIDLCIVDYLDLMSSKKRAFNENDEGGRVTGDLKQVAIDFHIPVLVCTQAATNAEKQETKERPFLTAADVFGTKRKVHSANTLVGIVNQTATVGVGERGEEEVKKHHLVICVPKNRDGGLFTFRLAIEVETGRVVPDEDNVPGISAEVNRANGIINAVRGAEDTIAPDSPLQDKARLQSDRQSQISGIKQLLGGENKPAVPERPALPEARLNAAIECIRGLFEENDAASDEAIKERLANGGFEDIANGEFAGIALRAARMLQTGGGEAVPAETGVMAGLPAELDDSPAKEEADPLDNSALFEDEDDAVGPAGDSTTEMPAPPEPADIAENADPWAPPPRLGEDAPPPPAPAPAGNAPLMRGILARLRKANDKAPGARERFDAEGGK